MNVNENEHLIVNINGPVMSCVLNRPESLNAFSDEMIAALQRALKTAADKEDIKAVILSGSGRAFSAGGDIKNMDKASPKDIYDHVGKLNDAVLMIKEINKPVIAVVHGYAAGAGLNLALACDQILAGEECKFVLSFAQVGLAADGGGSYFLTRLLGPYRAKELLFRAEPIPVETALEWGLVNQVIPLSDLEEQAVNYAIELSKGPGQAIGMMKKLVNQAENSELASILEQERLAQTLMVTTEDHKEGIQAFQEKRPPVFTGK
ncbi:enoyl-CoA hydratase [Halobacillus salinarum]|uniref:Enoyl-CoA hydratase n=1 Tax=Halobacillus salinarum TaxID=2932257 RepID=A0ABY4EIK1_9BACI|nr:enoyl-CoA hydratase [Halobacillus salinarum]UOQ43872.1 enoyl-CoA hydratase [Halobacillus salinarum]